MGTFAPAVPLAASPALKPRAPLYPHAQWYFLAAMVITWIGFSHTYFAVVTSEPLVHHIHGALMGGWIAILIVQPWLYQRGQLQLHRRIGRWAVYLWTPALVICGLFMDRRMLRTHNAPPRVIDQLAFLDLFSLLLFAILIALSTIYARNIQLHARYIVCTVLLLVPPALARALFIVPGMHSFRTNGNTAYALMDLVLLLLMLDDKRRGRLWPPYPLAFIAFTAMAWAGNYAREWSWWHGVASALAN